MEVISPGTWKHQGLPDAKERILTSLCEHVCVAVLRESCLLKGSHM